MFNRTNCISLVVRIVFFAGVVTVSAPANAQFVDELTKNVYIPNTFSPDGDEQNPVFLPVFSDPDLVTDYRLVVYNRKGEIIFESLDLRQGWDGMQFDTWQYRELITGR